MFPLSWKWREKVLCPDRIDDVSWSHMPSLLGGLLCRPQRFGFQKHSFVDDMRMRMIKPEMASRKAKFSICTQHVLIMVNSISKVLCDLLLTCGMCTHAYQVNPLKCLCRTRLTRVLGCTLINSCCVLLYMAAAVFLRSGDQSTVVGVSSTQIPSLLQPLLRWGADKDEVVESCCVIRLCLRAGVAVQCEACLRVWVKQKRRLPILRAGSRAASWHTTVAQSLVTDSCRLNSSVLSLQHIVVQGISHCNFSLW